MKTLANCSPREFLKQTNRIRRAAERWLDATGLLALRKPIPPDVDTGDPEALRAATTRQMKANARAMLDALLEKHPDETAELLGLMCFIEPEELDDHPMSELIGALAGLIGCREVVDFFTSLARWGRGNTSTAAGR